MNYINLQNIFRTRDLPTFFAKFFFGSDNPVDQDRLKRSAQAYARGSAPGCWTQTPNARFKSEGQIAQAGAGDQQKNKID
jgi:hypothetical protein